MDKILVKYFDENNKTVEKFCKIKDAKSIFPTFSLMGMDYAIRPEFITPILHRGLFTKYYKSMDLTKLDAQYRKVNDDVLVLKQLCNYSKVSKWACVRKIFWWSIENMKSLLIFFVTLPFYPVIMIILAIKGKLDY